MYRQRGERTMTTTYILLVISIVVFIIGLIATREPKDPKKTLPH
jgi:hypothetical protein